MYDGKRAFLRMRVSSPKGGENIFPPPFLSTVGEWQRSHLIHLAPISRLVPSPSCIFLSLSLFLGVWEVAFVIPLLLLLIPRCVCVGMHFRLTYAQYAHTYRRLNKGRKGGRTKEGASCSEETRFPVVKTIRSRSRLRVAVLIPHMYVFGIVFVVPSSRRRGT